MNPHGFLPLPRLTRLRVEADLRREREELQRSVAAMKKLAKERQKREDGSLFFGCLYFPRCRITRDDAARLRERTVAHPPQGGSCTRAVQMQQTYTRYRSTPRFVECNQAHLAPHAGVQEQGIPRSVVEPRSAWTQGPTTWSQAARQFRVHAMDSRHEPRMRDFDIRILR